LLIPAENSLVQFQIHKHMLSAAGNTTEDVTNSDGSVWSRALVCGPAATQLEVTPQAMGNIFFGGMKISPAVIAFFSVDTAGEPSSFHASDVESNLQSQLSSNVFNSPPTGHSVKVKVVAETTPSGKQGWNGNPRTSIFNRVDWTSLSGIPAKRDGNGLIQIDNTKIEEFAAPYITQNVGTQTWVNIFAHEGIWGNAAQKNDCELFCTDGEISVGSGFYSAYLFAPYSVSSSSRTIIRSKFGF
jgi:hypothetical protein